MEKALEWWDKLPKWKQEKYANDEQWTDAKSITNHQIKMIYDVKADSY